MLQGGVHGLASVVRVRSPSAPLKRAQYGAPSAHPALESPLCARDAKSNWTAARARAAFRKRAS
eukprot:4518615-Prymnesium_polylepis.1